MCLLLKLHHHHCQFTFTIAEIYLIFPMNLKAPNLVVQVLQMKVVRENVEKWKFVNQKGMHNHFINIK